MRKACRRKIRGTGLPTIYGLTEEMRNDLQIIPLGILESFREGNGNEVNWHTLAAAINVGAVLARKQGPEVCEVVETGMKALMALKTRGNGIGKWILTGDEYRAIRSALLMATDLQDASVSTRRDIAEAIRTTLREAAI
jgi:hypothetical protein